MFHAVGSWMNNLHAGIGKNFFPLIFKSRIAKEILYWRRKLGEKILVKRLVLLLELEI